MTSSLILGGPDTRTWLWEQALNIFSVEPHCPIVPSREEVIKQTWLKWETRTHLRGPSNHVPTNLIHAEGMTFFTSWYGVADATKELDDVAAKYFGNANSIVDSLYNDLNAVGNQRSFEAAATTLEGVATWLTAQVAPLETERNKTGHRGDDFQGTGASAFWTVLDKLAFTCRDLVDQMSHERTSWTALRDAKGLLKHGVTMLYDGRAFWQGDNSFTYDTGLGFAVTGPGSQLSSPTGVVRAIWQSPELVADFGRHFPPKYTREKDGWPVSDLLGGSVTETAPREKLEIAAKWVWRQHLTFLDSWGASTVGLLAATYQLATARLPTIKDPAYVNLTPGGTGGDDSGGDGTGGDGTGPGGGNGSGGDKGPIITTTSTPPPPPPPPRIIRTDTNVKNGPGGVVPPPITRIGGGGPNTTLKVPTGSYVGRDGTVIGPNGKPVLGSDGRPIIVPPGSRVNANGEIVGPRNGGNLEQKDRLRKAYPPPETRTGVNETALERHLNSLRRSTPPPLPALRAPDAPPLTMSKFDPQANFHSGPGSLGGGRIGVSPPTTSLGGNPVTPPAASAVESPKGTLGGPKGTMGNGVPFYPPSAGGAGAGGAGQDKGERERETWLAEDEETWGTDPTVAPGVLGRRRRRTRRPGGAQVRVNQDGEPSTRHSINPAAGQGTGTTTG